MGTVRRFGIGAGLVLAACGGAGGTIDDDNDAELQALLRDAPVSLPTTAARTTEDVTAQPLPFDTQGYWSFDDCDPGHAELQNAHPLINTAFRSVGVTCTPGLLGTAVALAAPEDIVYVPDQPYFVFDAGVSVAGWFRPDDVERTQTLFRKRDKGTSAFALVLHRGRYRFVVDLGGGRAAAVSAPGSAHAGEFHHVAASYDGAAIRLYLDGAQVAERDVAGTIAPGPGPLLIGNDGSERRFDGAIDEVVFDLHALTAQQMLRLTCIPADASVVATPATSAPTPPDVTASFDIAVTNHNSAACDPVTYTMFVNPPGGNIDLDPATFSQVSAPIASGDTVHFPIRLTPYDSGSPGTFDVRYDVLSFDGLFRGGGLVDLVVVDPPGCHVSKAQELLITHFGVIEDDLRTRNDGPPGDPRTGAWTLKHLVEEAAPSAADAPAMLEDLLRSFTQPQQINGFTVAPRSGMADVLAAWPRTPDGQLDLAQAPVHLMAIVDRIDLRNLDRSDAGVAAFIYRIAGPDDFPLDATLMFEYRLPAASDDDVLGWAQAFHGLGALPFSEAYNVALQAITDRIVRRGARPDGVNTSALHEVRSAEASFDPDVSSWQFRQFALSPATGRLVPVALDGTPDRSFSGTQALAGFINANRDAILAGTATVPDQIGGQPFRAGAVRSFFGQIWTAPGVDADARSAFAVSTCDGCHSPTETGAFFHQLTPQFSNDLGEPFLSPFLRGGSIADPVSGATRTFNDLRRRRFDLESLVCAPPGEVQHASLRRGSARMH